jgi:hypothetical protein
MRPPVLLFALALLLPAATTAQEVPPRLAGFAEALAAGPVDLSGLRGRTYVPAYSSLMAAGGGTRIDFSVTLAIHNGSATRGIAIERIEYHDTTGRLVETPLERPVTLKPYGTIQVTIPQPDTRGGLGADFVVDWTAPTAGTEPIVEAVMLSSHGNQSYGFVSPGRKVER